jgi:superfamily II helicase
MTMETKEPVLLSDDIYEKYKAAKASKIKPVKCFMCHSNRTHLGEFQVIQFSKERACKPCAEAYLKNRLEFLEKLFLTKKATLREILNERNWILARKNEIEKIISVPQKSDKPTDTRDDQS